MRYGLNLPIRLFTCLDRYCKAHGDKGLFAEQKDLRWFIKTFPQFAIAEKI